MQEISVGKTYRHYKGNIYTIIALAKHSETMEDMVVYRSIDTGQVWTRPMSMWNDEVLINAEQPSSDNHSERTVLRFTLI